MIQLHVSKTLASDLKPFLIEASVDPQAMQWYAHRVLILRRKCVIAMELNSRYAILFPALVKKDFKEFSEIFRMRLVNEAVSVCAKAEPATEKIAALALLISEQIQIHPGSDRSVQAHINDVARELDWMARDIGRLPETNEEAFGFGLRVNLSYRRRKQDKDYFIPFERFREFWLGALKFMDSRGHEPLH